MRILFLVALALFAATDALSRSADEEAACAEVKEEIREIESKMRAGYTRAQGEKYEARFGYVFLVCATGKTAAEMLDIVQKRLSSKACSRDCIRWVITRAASSSTSR